jgi:hypothetical protein
MKYPLRILAVIAVVVATLLGSVGSVSTATTATSSSDNGDNGNNGDLIRWDLIHLNPSTLIALPGGAASAEDPATGEVIRLTGSGQFDPADETASGGGTFAARDADGSLIERGAFVVSDFISWQPLAGSIVGTPIIDGVGEKPDARSGIVTLEVAGYVRGEFVGHATLEVHCALPGAPAGSHEGVTVVVEGGPSFTTMVDHGPTIFHTLDD